MKPPHQLGAYAPFFGMTCHGGLDHIIEAIKEPKLVAILPPDSHPGGNFREYFFHTTTVAKCFPSIRKRGGVKNQRR